MISTRNSVILISCLFVSLADVETSEVKHPVVASNNYVYIGDLSPNVNTTVYTFTGIRYAQAPVGELRFAKPRPLPIPPRPQYVDARNYGDICPQYAGGSEDCLTINVYTPTLNAKAHLPVLIHIHGGALDSGSAFAYDGSHLVETGNVVFVAFNYRLTLYGFLYGGSDKWPGNVGFFDQRLALEWIRDNIAAFGGDPNHVTITGLSAGGISTNYHLLAPKSWNLFDKAIAMSGTLYTQFPYTANEALKYTRNFVRSVGCELPGNDRPVDIMTRVAGREQKFNVKPISDYELSCMRSKSTRELVMARIQYSTNVSAPVDDGDFLGASLAEIFREKILPKGKHVLFTSVPNDAAVIEYFGGIAEDMSTLLMQIDSTMVENFQHRDIANLTSDIKNIYQQPINVSKERIGMFRRAVYNHRFFYCGAHDMILRLGDAGNRVSSMLFNYIRDEFKDPKAHPILRCPFGAYHGFDGMFAMGVPIELVGVFNDEDRQFSVKLMKMYTEFVHTGSLPFRPYVKTNDGDIIPFQYMMESMPYERINPDYFQCETWVKLFNKAIGV